MTDAMPVHIPERFADPYRLPETPGHPFTPGPTQSTTCVWILPDDPDDASITRYCGLKVDAHVNPVHAGPTL